MSRIAEFNVGGAAAGLSQAVTVTSAVAAGQIVHVSIGAQHATATCTVTDSRGNTYAVDSLLNATDTTYTRHAYSVLTTPLQAGDTITVTASASVTRWALSVGVFDAPATPVVGNTVSASQPTTASPSAGPIVTVRANALIVGSAYFLNSGRTPTAANGWSIGTKVVSTAGSAERATLEFWRYATTAGTYTVNPFTSDTSGTFGLVARVLETPSVVTPPAGTDHNYVIVGGVKKAVTGRYVIIGGGKKPVTNVSVIIGGVKKAVNF